MRLRYHLLFMVDFGGLKLEGIRFPVLNRRSVYREPMRMKPEPFLQLRSMATF